MNRRVRERLLSFAPRFPLREVVALGQALQTSGHLVPGFIPPSVGYLDIAALRYAQDLEGWTLVVMADRNFISRMAEVCRLDADTSPDAVRLGGASDGLLQGDGPRHRSVDLLSRTGA